MLVTDLPIFEAFEPKTLVYDLCEVRRGLTPEGNDVLVFWRPDAQLHVDMSAKGVSFPISPEIMTAVMNNLFMGKLPRGWKSRVKAYKQWSKHG